MKSNKIKRVEGGTQERHAVELWRYVAKNK